MVRSPFQPRDLKWWEWGLVNCGFSVETEYCDRPHWESPMVFYAFKCSTHGIVEHHIVGRDNPLECPMCHYDRVLSGLRNGDKG